MSNEISVTEAAINTATVEIKTIQVRGKQMTLAVFRQIPVAGYYGPDIEPWGVVNYAVKSEGNQWLVFALNGTLYKRQFAQTRYEQHRLQSAERRVDDIRRAIQQGDSRIYVYWDGGLAGEMVPSAGFADALKKAEESVLSHRRLLLEQNDLVDRDDLLRESLPQIYIAV